MKDPTILVAINSFLLSITSAAFLIISFFLKDIYRDFKKQMEKTQEMHAELNVHVKLFQELSQIFQSQMEELHRRVARLEHESRLLFVKDKKEQDL